MDWSFMKEIGRKAIHLTIIIVLFIYIAVERTYGKQNGLLVLTGILILFLLFEHLRLEFGIKLPYFSRFIRPKEENRMYGVIYFLSGVIISIAVYDIKIAF